MKNSFLLLIFLSFLMSCVQEQAPTDYTGFVRLEKNQDIHFFVKEDSQVPVRIMANEDDSNIDLKLNLLSTPENGELINCDKQDKEINCLYVPHPNFNGENKIAYSSSDGSFKSGKSFVKIHVTPVPDGPILRGRTLYFSTYTNRNLRFVLPRAIDIDSKVIAYELLSGAEDKNLNCQSRNNLFICNYLTPTPSVKRFSYRAYDESGLRSAEVYFEINAEAKTCGSLTEGAAQSKIYYKTSQVPYGSKCEQEERTRSCHDGELTPWSGSYLYNSCEVQAPRPCGNMLHGNKEHRTRYLRSSEPYNGKCQSEVQSRTCNNGSLSSWNGSYTQVSCNVKGAKNCGTLAHGSDESRIRYEELEVSVEKGCKSETQKRSCSEGTLSSWSGRFTNLSCKVVEAASCGDIKDGTSDLRIMYKKRIIEYGETCEAQAQYRSCQDGYLGRWSGTYTEKYCSVKGAVSCDDIPHGGKDERTKYKKNTVESGEKCESETQYRLCTNGDLSSWSGTYLEDECRKREFYNCAGLGHGESESRVRYEEGVAQEGRQCEEETQTRLCVDGEFGNWSGGDYSYTSCTQTTKVNSRSQDFLVSQKEKPRIKIALLVDQSLSMKPFQNKLGSNVSQMLTELDEYNLEILLYPLQLECFYKEPAMEWSDFTKDYVTTKTDFISYLSTSASSFRIADCKMYPRRNYILTKENAGVIIPQIENDIQNLPQLREEVVRDSQVTQSEDDKDWRKTLLPFVPANYLGNSNSSGAHLESGISRVMQILLDENNKFFEDLDFGGFILLSNEDSEEFKSSSSKKISDMTTFARSFAAPVKPTTNTLLTKALPVMTTTKDEYISKSALTHYLLSKKSYRYNYVGRHPITNGAINCLTTKFISLEGDLSGTALFDAIRATGVAATVTHTIPEINESITCDLIPNVGITFNTVIVSEFSTTDYCGSPYSGSANIMEYKGDGPYTNCTKAYIYKESQTMAGYLDTNFGLYKFTPFESLDNEFLASYFPVPLRYGSFVAPQKKEISYDSSKEIIKDLLDKRIGESKYFLSTIIHDQSLDSLNSSCNTTRPGTTGYGGTYGSHYKGLVTDLINSSGNSNLFKVESICAPDYKSITSNIIKFTEEKSSSFKVKNLLGTEKVERVRVVRAGQSTTLQLSIDYKIEGSLVIMLKDSLIVVGDRVIIEISNYITETLPTSGGAELNSSSLIKDFAKSLEAESKIMESFND